MRPTRRDGYYATHRTRHTKRHGAKKWRGSSAESHMQLLCVCCMATGRSASQWASARVPPRLETWIGLFSSQPPLPTAVLPAIPPCYQRPPTQQLPLLTGFVWERNGNCPEIPHQGKALIDGKNWLRNEYLEGKIEVIIVASKKQRLIHKLQRCLESLRTTLPEKFRGKYVPYNRLIRIPSWQFPRHPGSKNRD